MGHLPLSIGFTADAERSVIPNSFAFFLSHFSFASLLQFMRLTKETTNMQLTNMKQTAELVGVTYSALQSAIFHNKIPEPKLKIGSHKASGEYLITCRAIALAL